MGTCTRSSSKKSLRGYSRLPHGRPRRPCGRVRRVRAPRHLVQFLPQQALSKMPGHGARQMAGRKGGRVVAGPVFPGSIYGASKHRWPGTPECAPDLSHSISRGIGNAAHDCSRPETAGRRRRFSCCPTDQRQRRAGLLILDKADLASSPVVNGDKISCTILICTAWLQAAVSRPTASVGYRVLPAFFSP